jgi:transcription-repair coupling factor (superfamily II helicase)
LERLNYIARAPGHFALTGAPGGYDAYLAAEAAKRHRRIVLFVTADDAAAQAVEDAIAFFAPDLRVLPFPAWDCLPYDRLSPKPDTEGLRLSTLAALAARVDGATPIVVVTPIHALLQRVPPRAAIRQASFLARAGQVIEHEQLVGFFVKNGYARASTVREPGDFALRGGIIDLWPPGADDPLRLDFFGNSLEAIKRFDAETQLSREEISEIELLPASETPLDPESISRFRSGYVAAFGPPGPDDLLYEAISAGRKHQGMEHWLPLFHSELETLFDYLEAPLVFVSHQVEDVRAARHDLIVDYYRTRRQLLEGTALEKSSGPPYRPLPPEQLYLTDAEWKAVLSHRMVRDLSPFQAPESTRSVDAGGKTGRDFAPERAQGRVNVFEAAAEHLKSLLQAKKRVVVAAWSEGSAERLGGVLSDHGLGAMRNVANWPDALSMHTGAVGVGVLGLDHGFEAPDMAIVTEQDILGERMARARTTKARRAQNFLAEASSLSQGDLVTHIEHGIGRYTGLQTIDAAGAPHDCLELQYDGGKLFLPVENIELLTRYGGDESTVQLDRLGGAGWQLRKARMKQRVREIAAELIRIAAARQLKSLPVVEPPQGLYDEFCARFPWQETEDQDRAIAETIEDLAKGRPMDRLVCGDVGFGKTEVALRASFVEAMAGAQVAVVVPTTLLARQHYKTFSQRFQDFPVKVRQLSRFVSTKEARETKAGLEAGDIDIVVGTHALLAKSTFKRLGLVIVDEEQHFGVAHKERLKSLKSDVHVLTLTATPIPRTLQLALSGVRDLSLITTPPIDRLAVRTFVTPFDALTVREALLREHYRGGQSFYVCPRIADIADAMEFLKHTVPEVKTAIGHGQMPAAALEDVMAAFYDGKVDVLVSTNIVESGLDIPTANTLIVHRADMFGLSQLYQLRGRIGRAKQRAYAYLTTPADRKLTETAGRRLQVLQSLDQLGAGFSIASHDMDIRGAGNLLGEEQSGHVREVGIELYQEMLEEAVSQLRSGETVEADEQWSPQINIGTSVLIPEHYVPDLDVRMALYRRLAGIESADDIDHFAAELIDRFGALPEEVQHLLDIVAIKALCRYAQVEKIEAGPKGATLAFRNNSFPNPAGLVRLIAEHQSTMRVRPDRKVVIARDWPTPEARLKGVQTTLGQLVRLAEKKAA